MAAQRHEDETGGAEGSQLEDADAAALDDLRREARAGSPLAARVEAELLERAALGDRASEDRLVAANLGMVIRFAEAREEAGLTVLELVQEGSIGLVEAVRSFADSGAADFSSYAEQRVGAQIDSAIRAEAAAVRDAQLLITAATDYERTQILLRRELHRNATEQELAEKLEWTVERTRYVAKVVADARRRHDEELLAFVDPEIIEPDDDEPPEFDR